MPAHDAVLIIPAAGAGTRLKSPLPKVLTPVNGRPMVDHLLARYEDAVSRVVLVVHPDAERLVRAHLLEAPARVEIAFARQPRPTGMLDAILLAADAIGSSRDARVWITWCDQVGVHPSTIATLRDVSTGHPDVPVILPTVEQPEPYIHFERDAEGHVIAVRQRREGDAMPPIGESDMGLFSLSPEAYFAHLPAYARDAEPSGGTGERNFLPFITWLAHRGHPIVTFPAVDPREAIGVNTPDDRRRLEMYLREIERA